MSGYICAGFESIAHLVNVFYKEDYGHLIPRDRMNDFFRHGCDKFLHSFGQNFVSKRVKRHLKNEKRLLVQCKGEKNEGEGLLGPGKLYIDSGGFQISVGILDQNDCDLLLKVYYEFIEENCNLIDRAFILDIPPGPGCKIFETFDDVYNLNKYSYYKAANLCDEIRNKMVYIHHFRTPKLWDIYTKLLDKEEMFTKFNYHATGGIVASLGSDVSIPCIIYVLPLIPLINRAKAAGRKFLSFHILGGASYRDIFFYELFKRHVKAVHDIELEITYDSSTVFKGFMYSRIAFIFRNEQITRIDLRQAGLDHRWNGGLTIRKAFEEAINGMADRFGFERVSFDQFYDPETNTFPRHISVYCALFILYFYGAAEEFFVKKAEEIYPLFATDRQEFNNQIMELTKDINGGRITRKQKSKSSSVSNSLEMLTQLDEKHCKYIIDKWLAKDEFVGLYKDERSVIYG